jgi:acylphosphatase
VSVVSIQFRLIVRGVVQGVGFRQSTLEAALRIGGLSGWVTNLSDGSVEIMVQGEATKVAQLVAWAMRGPGAPSRVDSVEQVECDFDPSLEAFSIRYE